MIGGPFDGLVGDDIARALLADGLDRFDALVASVTDRVPRREDRTTELIGDVVGCFLSLGLDGGAGDLSRLQAEARLCVETESSIDAPLQAVATVCHAISSELTDAVMARGGSAVTIAQLAALSFETQTVLSQALVETFVAHRGREELAGDEARAEVARAFLDGRYSRSSRWLEHARGLGADPLGGYVVVCLRPQPGRAGAATRGLSDDAEAGPDVDDADLETERLQAVVRRALRDLPVFSACLAIDGLVAAVVSLAGLTVERVRNALDHVNLGDHFEAGMGRPVDSAAGLPTAFDQARIALLDASDGPTIRLFDGLSLVDVGCLTALRSGAAPLPGWLEELNATLPRGEAPLARTIEVWLDRDLNVAETATELVVHPNTVNYRLRQVEAISGLDTKRFDDVAQLALALRLHALVGKVG